MQNIINFLIKHNHWFLLLVLEGISFVLIVSFNSYQGATMFTTANNVAGNIYMAINDVDSYFGLKSENVTLQNHNKELLEELQVLRNKLDIVSDSCAIAQIRESIKANSAFHYHTASVVNNSINRINNFITIDKGSADGITNEMGVFDERGVIGIVYRTSENFALVMSLLNSKSNLSCKIGNSNSFCSLQWQGGDTRYAHLIDLPQYATYEKGDTVITSGFSSFFPANIPVGIIEETVEDGDDIFNKAKVKLLVNFSNISKVYLVGNDKKEEQEQLEKEIKK